MREQRGLRATRWALFVMLGGGLALGATLVQALMAPGSTRWPWYLIAPPMVALLMLALAQRQTRLAWPSLLATALVFGGIAGSKQLFGAEPPLALFPVMVGMLFSLARLALA